MKLIRSLFTVSMCALSVCATIACAQSAPRIHDVESLSWMPSAAPGLELAVVEGNPQGPGPYVVAMRYKAGTTTPPHSHPEEMNLVVVKGQFFVGVGDRAESSGNKMLNPGSVVVIPKGSHHSEGAITDSIVLLYGSGPMRIDLVGGFLEH